MRAQRLLYLLLLTFMFAGSLVAQTSYKYSYVPKQVYSTQVFPITIFADIDDNEHPPLFSFAKNSPSQPISSTPLKDTNGGNTFYTFYFKANSNDIKTPELTIIDQAETTVLESRYIPVTELDTSKNKEFCGLIATNCKMLASQVSAFDAQNNLISLTLKATEANPEELHTPGSIESGVEKIMRKESSVIIEYYFVIPSSQKSITSSYYNTIQHKFISKTISTEYKDKPVAAQENLNPRDSSFDKLKKYGLALLALLFLILFWKQRDFLYLVLLALCVIILLTLYTPHGKICIQEGSPLYILPTSTSTTGGQISKEMETDILNTRDKYYKIEYENGMIGWVKDEDLCKD